MNGIKDLERSALDAHRNGQGWSEFWQQHADAIRKAEPLPGDQLVPYLNRLADLLWILARAAEQGESRSATPSRATQES